MVGVAPGEARLVIEAGSTRNTGAFPHRRQTGECDSAVLGAANSDEGPDRITRAHTGARGKAMSKEDAPEVESGAVSEEPNVLGIEQMLNANKLPSIAAIAQAFLADGGARTLREVALGLAASVKQPDANYEQVV